MSEMENNLIGISEKCDVIIVGGGPIGINAAIMAQKAGLKYLILEKGTVVNSLYHYPLNMTFFSTSERLEIGQVPFMSLNAKPTKQEALEYYRRVIAHFDLKIELFNEVEAIERQENGFKVFATKGNYESKYIILATGFYDLPVLLNVPGESLSKVSHYYHDPFKYAFQKVVIVGAMNSAVDAALECWRKGSDVTMVIRGNQIGQRVKYWIRPDIENRIIEGSIKAWFNSQIIEIKKESVVVNTPNGIKEIDNDWVLAMTGYRPNLVFLESLGIQFSNDKDQNPIINESTMETNVKDI